jgi:uncharacterized radical SAM superfamily Fe-S cluster-containing enzyme
MRATRKYTYLGTVTGMCRSCRELGPSRIVEEDGVVYQERLCPRCGHTRTRIADDVKWYLDRMAAGVHCVPFREPGNPVRRGCPLDCGPCAFHANACHLPVFSVTNDCNMQCPICFTFNRPDRRYFMSREELRALIDNLIRRCGPMDLVNITGGEPTLHPGILDLIRECRRPEIGRVTMNSNGLRLAKDESLCAALAELGAYVVLSFDTFREDVSIRIHGRNVVADKLQALENLQRHGVGVTLLNVMIRGLNDGEIGAVIDLARSHSVVRSVTVQTMTFTGSGGKSFQPRVPMPLDGAAVAIETATGGRMRRGDFLPHPGAHPLCYSVAYYLRDASEFHSLADYFPGGDLRRLLGHGYLPRPDDDAQTLFRDAIDRLWSDGDKHGLLPSLRRLVERMFPQGNMLGSSARQRVAEEGLLAVYLHAHMDEDTLDIGRLVCCPDQVPDPEGRLIPACAYNLFYREKDPRFWCQ